MVEVCQIVAHYFTGIRHDAMCQIHPAQLLVYGSGSRLGPITVTDAQLFIG